MDCKQTHPLIFLFADDEPGDEMLVALRDHLEVCPRCAQHAHYARRFVTIVRERFIRCPAPTHLRDRILAVMPHRRLL
jgi:Putative zinc-finger